MFVLLQVPEVGVLQNGTCFLVLSTLGTTILNLQDNLSCHTCQNTTSDGNEQCDSDAKQLVARLRSSVPAKTLKGNGKRETSPKGINTHRCIDAGHGYSRP